MMVKTQDNETIVVALTADTQVQELLGAFKMRKKELGMTALIPGLPVQVKGTMKNILAPGSDGHLGSGGAQRYNGRPGREGRESQSRSLESCKTKASPELKPTGPVAFDLVQVNGCRH
jgi:hypothetical protein